MSGIIPDYEIQRLSEQEHMIKPFVTSQKSNGVISYGLSSYGYDCRLDTEFYIFTDVYGSIIDPKNFNDGKSPSSPFVEIITQDPLTVPPNSFVLCKTVETIKVPRDMIVQVMAKSTYARCGLVVNATIFEPEWEGTVTLELSNTTRCPIKIYPLEGIVQLIFYRCEDECDTSYLDRDGKYMYQKDVTFPVVKDVAYSHAPLQSIPILDQV